MIFGYRKYAISRFSRNGIFSSFWYAVFVMQCVLSSFITSVRYQKGLAPLKEVIRAHRITREFEQEIGSGNLERFNAFLSTLV